MSDDITHLGLGVSELPHGWRITSVGEVAEVNDECIQSNYPHKMIKYIDISSVDRGTIGSTNGIPLEEAPSRARRIVRDHDTIISTVRPNLEHYAFIQRAAPNLVASTGFAVVSAKNADPRFLYYYLTTPQFTNYLVRIAESHTSAYPAFNPGVIENSELLLPPDQEQRAIAHILGTFDDKIELNRCMNETLEAIARAIFKSWFVDFEPVRAKAEGRDTGLPKHLADLFPDRFVDSELGEIPEGWEIGDFKDLFILQRGFDLPKRLRIPGPYQVIAASGPSTYHHEAKVKGPGVVTGRSGVLGKVYLVQDDHWPLNTTLWIRKYNLSRPYHAYFFLQQLDLELFNAGSAVPTLNRNHIHNLPVILPRANVIEHFDSIAERYFKKKRTTEKESRILADSRDSLLPNLISGHLRIPRSENSAGKELQ